MTRWMLVPAISVALVACGTPDLEADPPRITVSQLEDARTHQAYTAWLTAKAGTPPLEWSVDGELPPGLLLNEAGAITGVPTDKASTELTVTVIDADGRTDSADLSLDVRWSKNTVGCDQSRTGTFTDVAHLDFYEVDWDATKGWALLEIPLPPPEITRMRVEIGGDQGFFPVYQARPGTPEGDQDLERNYINQYSAAGLPITIDLGSYLDLPSYRAYGEPIQILVPAEIEGDWEASTTCSAGPVIQSTAQSPTRVGEPLTVNYSVYGEQGAVTWEVDSLVPLPAWATFEPDSARITGIPPATGTWEFTLVATDEAGNTDQLGTGFGVYDTVPVACDERVEWTPTEGYYEGFAALQSDPEGYRVLELEVPADVSAVQAIYESPDGGAVSVVAVGDEPWVPSSYEGDFSAGTFEDVVGPDTAPSIVEYLDAGVLYAVAWENYGGTDPAALTLRCDTSPAVARPALPVLEAAGGENHPLPAVGGTPPYTFTATGLPSGVSLSPDGTLSTTSPPAGTHPVQLSIQDDAGVASVWSTDLAVGDAAACQGRPLLDCGSVLEGQELGAGERVEVCLSPRIAEENALVALVLGLQSGGAVDGFVVDPGADPTDEGTWVLAPRGPSSSGRVLDEIRSPRLSAFTDLPVFLALESTNGAVYDLLVECY